MSKHLSMSTLSFSISMGILFMYSLISVNFSMSSGSSSIFCLIYEKELKMLEVASLHLLAIKFFNLFDNSSSFSSKSIRRSFVCISKQLTTMVSGIFSFKPSFCFYTSIIKPEISSISAGSSSLISNCLQYSSEFNYKIFKKGS